MIVLSGSSVLFSLKFFADRKVRSRILAFLEYKSKIFKILFAKYINHKIKMSFAENVSKRTGSGENLEASKWPPPVQNELLFYEDFTLQSMKTTFSLPIYNPYNTRRSNASSYVSGSVDDFCLSFNKRCFFEEISELRFFFVISAHLVAWFLPSITFRI
jgi:hypothetical protein